MSTPATQVPTVYLPNATNGTHTLVLNTAASIGTVTIPGLSDADANATTGNIEEILYRLMQQVATVYAAQTQVPQNFSCYASVTPGAGNVVNSSFTFNFKRAITDTTPVTET